MPKNMGLVDRVIRIVLAVAVGVLYFTNMITGVAAIVLGILAAVFLATSLIGTCPLYIPFKLDTNGKKS